MPLGRSRITARDLGWAGPWAIQSQTLFMKIAAAKQYASHCSVTGGDKLGWQGSAEESRVQEIDRVIIMVCAAEVPKYRQTIGLYCSDSTLAFIHSVFLHWEPHQ